MENTWPNSQKSMKIHTCTLSSTAPKLFLKRNKNLIGGLATRVFFPPNWNTMTMFISLYVRPFFKKTFKFFSSLFILYNYSLGMFPVKIKQLDGYKHIS